MKPIEPMKPMHNLFFSISLLSLSFCLSFSALANNNLPVYIKANAADFNNKLGKGYYQGNVQVDQGHTKLRAESAETTSNENNQLIEAIAYGSEKNRAFYTEKNKSDQDAIEARAITIKYYPEDDKILLIGDAEVTQGRDTYNAPHIEYNIKTEHVTSKANEKGRTVIVIHPDDHRKATS